MVVEKRPNFTSEVPQNNTATPISFFRVNRRCVQLEINVQKGEQGAAEIDLIAASKGIKTPRTVGILNGSLEFLDYIQTDLKAIGSGEELRPGLEECNMEIVRLVVFGIKEEGRRSEKKRKKIEKEILVAIRVVQKLRDEEKVHPSLVERVRRFIESKSQAYKTLADAATNSALLNFKLSSNLPP